VPGVSIAVINDYKIDWAKAYGLADTTQRVPTTVNTMFSAGSISKLLMAGYSTSACAGRKAYARRTH
jgi:CubicO group peptidase (beta-lactamase class C family)